MDHFWTCTIHCKDPCSFCFGLWKHNKGEQTNELNDHCVTVSGVPAVSSSSTKFAWSQRDCSPLPVGFGQVSSSQKKEKLNICCCPTVGCNGQGKLSTSWSWTQGVGKEGGDRKEREVKERERGWRGQSHLNLVDSQWIHSMDELTCRTVKPGNATQVEFMQMRMCGNKQKGFNFFLMTPSNASLHHLFDCWGVCFFHHPFPCITSQHCWTQWTALKNEECKTHEWQTNKI